MPEKDAASSGEVPVYFEKEAVGGSSSGSELDNKEAVASLLSNGGGNSSGNASQNFPRVNSLPPEILNSDKLIPPSSQLKLEISKTERHRHDNILAEDAAQIFDDKIPIKEKISLLKRIATVKDDGTVEFEVPGDVEPQTLGVRPENVYNEVDDDSLDSAELQDIPPLQIVILIVGTRGDVTSLPHTFIAGETLTLIFTVSLSLIMPSLTIPEHISPDLHNEKKEKNRKMKSNAAIEAPELDSSVEKKSKKEKKNKKNSSDSDDFTFHDSEESCLEKKKKSKKKEKKRKASEINEDDEEERSETSSELGEPVNLKDKNKVKLMELDGIEEGEEKEENPNAVSNFRISEPLRNALKSRGIEALFPIQAMTFNTILDGSDLVGRARTGQGKTLAFVLPILESLTNGPSKASRKTGYGRAPSVLVLLPTRELATQVSADFEIYGGALGLTSCCLYGGAPYQAQHIQLKRGVDIVVGTPGRIKDHIDRGNIDFSSLKFRVLDEADEMLRMGFVEDVELILGKVEDANKVQTLLFSATLPVWVKQISSRFLKPDKKTADLVGNERMKASADVRHIVIPCSGSARAQLIPDIIRCYSSGGRTIIFTETKDSASQLAGILPGARALHGDIQQATREVTLSGFRSGKFMTLVATNVAARGLDINDVQLIIQCEPPRDVEAYIHRSGRTGRAGNTGVAVMLYDPRRSNFSRIERESGVKFEHIAAPQPADIAKAAGLEAVETITEVSDSVIPIFKSAAEELLNTSGLSPVELLAKALAKTTGYTEIKSRSLLTSMENFATVLLKVGRPIYTPSVAYSILRRFLPEEKVETVKGLALTVDGKGAVFDVSAEDLDTFLAGQENAADVSLEVVKELPPLQEREQPRGGRFGRGRGGFADRRSGGRFSGGRGGFSDRRNDRFSRGRGGGNYKKW